MISANELRIGNWVLLDGFQHEFSKADFEYSNDHISEPIILTHEILEKCGFEKVIELYGYFYGKDADRVYFVTGGFEFEYCPNKKNIDNRFNLWKIYKYLHELQNLIYALTQTELTYKPNPTNNATDNE